MSTALGLRPRAVLISTSGIFPVYLLKPWVYLYLHIETMTCMYHSGEVDDVDIIHAAPLSIEPSKHDCPPVIYCSEGEV